MFLCDFIIYGFLSHIVSRLNSYFIMLFHFSFLFFFIMWAFVFKWSEKWKKRNHKSIVNWILFNIIIYSIYGLNSFLFYFLFAFIVLPEIVLLQYVISTFEVDLFSMYCYQRLQTSSSAEFHLLFNFRVLCY